MCKFVADLETSLMAFVLFIVCYTWGLKSALLAAMRGTCLAKSDISWAGKGAKRSVVECHPSLSQGRNKTAAASVCSRICSLSHIVLIVLARFPAARTMGQQGPRPVLIFSLIELLGQRTSDFIRLIADQRQRDNRWTLQ